jgi:hypothetical protein
MSLAIVEALQEKGSMGDVELHKGVATNFGGVSFRGLNRELMLLELAGLLWVSRLAKGGADRADRKTGLRIEQYERWLGGDRES